MSSALLDMYEPLGAETVEEDNIPYEKAEYIETTTGNKVSRKSVLCGSQHIVFNGKTIVKPKVVVRGDLANVRIGRHCIVESNTVVRPPYKRFKKGIMFFPSTIGDHCLIEEDVIIESGQIGSFVHIGKGAIIGKRCILKDCCRILPGTILGPDTVVPPFAVFAGTPGQCVGQLPECVLELHREYTMNYYKRFQPRT